MSSSTDTRILDWICKALAKGATIRATNPAAPVFITDGNTVVSNLTIEYPKENNHGAQQTELQS
jgi:hypothetical protein